jgi:hypothetical protein
MYGKRPGPKSPSQDRDGVIQLSYFAAQSVTLDAPSSTRIAEVVKK